jgi:hypothetical protein
MMSARRPRLASRGTSCRIGCATRASHAIDLGTTLPGVQTTVGHSNIATTSGYLHALPESSRALMLNADDNRESS